MRVYMYLKTIFLISQPKHTCMYVVGTHKKHLNETLLKSPMELGDSSLTRDLEVAGSSLTASLCCVLEQDTFILA